MSQEHYGGTDGGGAAVQPDPLPTSAPPSSMTSAPFFLRGFQAFLQGNFEDRTFFLALGASILSSSLLCLWAMTEESCTFDEGSHLASGYAILKDGDYRLNPDNPPLARILMALPLLISNVKWPADSAAVRNASGWSAGFELLYTSQNDADALLFWGRAPMVVLFAVLSLLIAFEARKLFGNAAGVVAGLLTAFSPVLLANAHLCTTDVAAATFILLAVLAYRSLLRRPTLAGACGAGAALGLALATKYNALCIPAAIMAMLLLRALENPDGSPGGSAWRRRAGMAGLLTLSGIAAYAVIWAIHGFRFEAASLPEPRFDWSSVDVPGASWNDAADSLRRSRLLPESYVYGFKLMQKNTLVGHPTYAFGSRTMTGWWWYFPMALLVKTPMFALVAFLIGVAGTIRAMLRQDFRTAHAAAFVLVYLTLAMSKNMAIGVRHVLPVYPFLILMASGLSRRPTVDSPPRTNRPSWGLILALGAIGETLISAPDFLAYFNAASRAVYKPYEMLVDANLDWGQDLRRLKKYMDQHGIATLKLSYFGAASPKQLGLKHERLPGFNLYGAYEQEWPDATPLKPGDVVAVSASNYVALFNQDPAYYPDLLSTSTLKATIGGSILIFEVRGPSR